ncbi:MAG TPA: CopD family protein [Methylocella sp.]|nr:CopD family protein [Methylocella sp.]
MSLLLDIFGFLSVILRGLGLVAQSFTFGGLAFLFLILKAHEPRFSADMEEIHSACQAFLRISAFSFAFFTIAALALNAAVLVGTLNISWLEAAGADFAKSDLVIFASALAIGLLAKGACNASREVALAGLALLALAVQLSLTHAASRLGLRWPLLLSDATHMLGAALWIGGLPYFLVALNRCHKPTDWRIIGRRYSLLAMTSVAAIAASGIAMAIAYVGSLEALYGTAYGVMVVTKFFLLLMLLVLGGANYLIVESLRRDPAAPILRLKRFAEVEIGLGVTTLFVAASLTSLPPGIDLSQDRLSFQEIVERLTPQFPVRLTSPDYDKLTIARLQAQISAAEARRTTAPQAYVPGEGIPLPQSAEDIAWSEYNHHWAGIFVLAIGFLALIEHLRWGRWAKHWPLIFLVMAAFLFLRADEEAWPLGEIGFFASLRDPDVTQHRIIMLLITLFGIFEWQVRLKGSRSGKAVLVFPLTTAIASAMLLVHSHAIANLKNELLIEISHVPLAFCGITAGWARWLELRLDARASRVASFVWPVAFILVGLMLLAYREA